MTTPTAYPAIEFHQYGSGDQDRLILFAAPAEEIIAWAGIPRKGWRLRALYQRWITPSREAEVKAFWDMASTYDRGGKKYLLGPTALTLASGRDVRLDDGKISLDYKNPLFGVHDDFDKIRVVAPLALAQLRSRLTADEDALIQEALESFEIPGGLDNHVLESALQIAQMAADPERFVRENGIVDEELRELIEALEAVSRPALVVDGQHRLFGAAQSSNEVWLPVVLMPNASWIDQVFQFVLINEAAKKVETSLLTDIFGNSLTPDEQTDVRDRLSASKIDVEARIAAVIADKHEESPFRGMVSMKIGGAQPTGVANGFLSENTIRQLIDGGRGVDGFRNGQDFYNYVVKPRFPIQETWDNWTTGRWRDFWFAFWSEVRDYYNDEASGNGVVLWGSAGQSNLTKAVTLRLFQQLYMQKAIERAKAATQVRNVLSGAGMSEEEIEKAVSASREKAALPDSLDDFRADLRSWFLAKGVPVRVFLKPWKKSLDDATGMDDLRSELFKAWETIQRGDRYRASTTAVFAIEDES